MSAHLAKTSAADVLQNVRGLKLLVVWATTRCQLRCRYCYMSAGDVHEIDLDPEVFATAASNLGVNAGTEIQIAGGEPLLVPDIVEAIVEQAHRLGSARISVQTNGLAIDERFIALVKRYRLGVGVSLDGPPAINERVRGRSADVLRGLASGSRRYSLWCDGGGQPRQCRRFARSWPAACRI